LSYAQTRDNDEATSWRTTCLRGVLVVGAILLITRVEVKAKLPARNVGAIARAVRAVVVAEAVLVHERERAVVTALLEAADASGDVDALTPEEREVGAR
jgi:hypothetical protein